MLLQQTQKCKRLKNYEKDYVDACKDDFKGKLKYDLVENLDGTQEWMKIK